MQGFKNLDEVVLDALNLHAGYALPELKFGDLKKILVIASGNALPTGRIIFKGTGAIFADEGQYKSALKLNHKFDGAVVISASGKKHAPLIIKGLISSGVNAFLLTCDGNSPAAKELIDAGKQNQIIVTKSLEEPVTYNTSTYLGMILSKTRENPKEILAYLNKFVERGIPKDLGRFNAFYLIIPPEFEDAREMFLTKFDELFGPMVNGRCYTSEQSRHAKTVVPSKSEMFISIGFQNELFGDKDSRWNVPLFPGADYAAVIAVGYYIIGKIQVSKPPYFRDNAAVFKKFQEEILFGKVFESKFRKFEVK